MYPRISPFPIAVQIPDGCGPHDVFVSILYQYHQDGNNVPIVPRTGHHCIYHPRSFIHLLEPKISPDFKEKGFLV